MIDTAQPDSKAPPLHAGSSPQPDPEAGHSPQQQGTWEEDTLPENVNPSTQWPPLAGLHLRSPSDLLTLNGKPSRAHASQLSETAFRPTLHGELWKLRSERHSPRSWINTGS